MYRGQSVPCAPTGSRPRLARVMIGFHGRIAPRVDTVVLLLAAHRNQDSGGKESADEMARPVFGHRPLLGRMPRTKTLVQYPSAVRPLTRAAAVNQWSSAERYVLQSRGSFGNHHAPRPQHHTVARHVSEDPDPNFDEQLAIRFCRLLETTANEIDRRSGARLQRDGRSEGRGSSPAGIVQRGGKNGRGNCQRRIDASIERDADYRRNERRVAAGARKIRAPNGSHRDLAVASRTKLVQRQRHRRFVGQGE